MDNDNAPMGGPLSEAEDAAARIRAYLDACSGANSFGREIRWELRDAEGHPYNLPRADLVAVLDGLAAEAKDCEILEEGYINAMDDYGNQMTEVEQARAENAKLLRKLELANKHRQHSIESRRKMERKLIGWREAAESAAKERDAYKRAKQENDERFQLAAAEAREERDEARARVGVLEEQLATAQAEVVIRDGAIVGRDKAIDSLEAWRRNWKPLVDAHMKRCSGCDACDSEDGDHV